MGGGFTGRPQTDRSERSHTVTDGHYRRGKSLRDSNDMMWDRAPSAPRFNRGSRDGNCMDRGTSRGRGRGHDTGSGLSNNTPNKKPALTKQNSSDLATEEWETASENSEKCDQLSDVKGDFDTSSMPNNSDDKRDGKKSFSSQRPSMQNRRANSTEKHRDSNRTTANGTSGRGRSSNNRNMNSNKKENIQAVYRVDEVVHNDPSAITSALIK